MMSNTKKTTSYIVNIRRVKEVIGLFNKYINVIFLYLFTSSVTAGRFQKVLKLYPTNIQVCL